MLGERYIEKRLKEFEVLGKKGIVTFNFNPFLNLKIKANIKTELMFCISTANSSAISGLKFQKSLESKKVEELEISEIENLLKKSGVRFYKRKARFILNAIKNFEKIFEILRLDSAFARKELIKLKGIGMKEASHFLRNIGRKDVAIIDRHILKWLCENEYIDKVPSSMSKKKYLEIENILKEIAKERNVTLAKLDLVIWYKMTGKILK